ncbi:ATP-binding protein [Lactiplantibacillus plantarum]|uniref:AAA family ATPase n=1 Tax=Lactiplantibacillus plantarum TaxID=1590 RepID=UPI000FF8B94D|nr:AAA family ATPase [Lactiplantibacillus plantarum]QAS01622.1 ATP-binding protein [Lactiplantibacillus plantarum]
MVTNFSKYIPALVEAAMTNDKRGIRMATNAIIRTLSRNDDKESITMMSKLKSLSSDYEIGKLTARGTTFSSELLLNRPILNSNRIILNADEQSRIDSFISGITHADLLMKNGVPPANSLLLYGKPGVGKTSIATNIAMKLNLPLLSVNLAELISSYLGSTGKNISRIIEQAHQQPSVLFFDEFDAIASERNSENDIAELRRIVNVLLVELDNWPADSVVIAATNHPEMLDSAIWRRFRVTLKIDLPNRQQRTLLWKDYLKTPDIFIEENFIKNGLSEIELSPSTIRNISLLALQQTLIDDIPIELAVIKSIEQSRIVLSKHEKVQLMKSLSEKPLSYTHRKIAQIFGLTHTTVGRYLKEE